MQRLMLFEEVSSCFFSVIISSTLSIFCSAEIVTSLARWDSSTTVKQGSGSKILKSSFGLFWTWRKAHQGLLELTLDSFPTCVSQIYPKKDAHSLLFSRHHLAQYASSKVKLLQMEIKINTYVDWNEAFVYTQQFL